MSFECPPLAPYPSTQERKSLSPYQAALLYEIVVKALQVTLSLPTTKLEDPVAITFVASYARDAARQVLDSLIWETELEFSANERHIRNLTFQLAECVASSTSLTAHGHGIDLQTLVSLSVAFARTHTEKIRSIMREAAQTNPQLERDVVGKLIPSFTTILSTDQISASSGLYAIRKAAHSLLSFVRVSPQDFVRPFSYNKEFMIALANTYDEGLTNIATSYGGVSALQGAIATDANPTPRDSDDWERIWVSTKVALVDAFHTILTCMLDDLASSSGRRLSLALEKALDVVFALLEIRPSSSSQRVPLTPFLNMSLVADYQRAFNLSHTLATALRHAEERDSRLDLLESTLQALDDQPIGRQTRSKDPGALKLLLRSSGLPQNVRYKHVTNRTEDRNVQASSSSAASHAKTTTTSISTANNTVSDPDNDIKVTQVLDIFPTHSPSYIRQLLEWPAYSGNAEKVIEALLENTAPQETELLAASRNEADASRGASTATEDDIARMVRERRNVFDDEIIDLSKLRIGKKTDDSQAVQGDRAYIEHIKADILRRVEEMELEDAEDEELGIGVHGATSSGKGKGKTVDTVEEDTDELDGLRRVKVIGDGESDDESDGVSDEGEEEENPETILELAYLRDPKLFDRDAATRRSKARADLKAQTGWEDEQIEGWKIMLERNPKKDKILQKHEFSGNRNWLSPQDPTPSASSSNTGGTSRGRGRGRGGGRGWGGRGGPPGGTSGPSAGDSTQKERATKDKHKASRGNHNRKRGHDRKMARAAGPPAG
ncbi:hypothetical protein JOM56_004218 [Amanita muscaria]